MSSPVRVCGHVCMCACAYVSVRMCVYTSVSLCPVKGRHLQVELTSSVDQEKLLPVRDSAGSAPHHCVHVCVCVCVCVCARTPLPRPRSSPEACGPEPAEPREHGGPGERQRVADEQQRPVPAAPRHAAVKRDRHEGGDGRDEDEHALRAARALQFEHAQCQLNFTQNIADPKSPRLSRSAAGIGVFIQAGRRQKF